jgi:hypothetical protein
MHGHQGIHDTESNSPKIKNNPTSPVVGGVLACL